LDQPSSDAGFQFRDWPSDAGLVLFVDQLEELLTVVSEEHRSRFVKLLATVSNNPAVRVLVTLRSDFLAHFAADRDLAPLLQGGTFVLAPPVPTALLDMVRGPAERAGLELENGLADQLLMDAGNDPGALPLVAFCLEELYREAEAENRLTLDNYNALGGLRGAIARRSAALLDELRETEGVPLDTMLPQLFVSLVHVDAAGTATRRRAPRNDITRSQPLSRLVDTLIRGRLLIAEGDGAQALLAVAHEALILEWPALRDWVHRNRERLQRVQRLLSSLVASEVEDRRYAVGELRKIRPPPPEVVSALIPRLVDSDPLTRVEVMNSLEEIGVAAAPALIEALGQLVESYEGFEIQRGAEEVLRRLRPWIVSDLATAVRHPVLEVRRIAIGILGESTRDEAGIAVPALIEALADENPGWAVSSLSSIGGPAALPLVAILDRPTQEPARFAVEALVRIGAEAVPELIVALGHPYPRTRRRAREALSRLGPRVAGKLGAALLGSGVEVRRGAAAVLKQLGSADSVLEADLICSLGDRLPDVRQRAREALRRLGSTAIPVLVDALGHQHRRFGN
jgi:HEAT repeat protein